jgi:hypothetical protein
MTQVAQVRAHLEAGKSLTPARAMAVYGIFRLASCIEDLRRAGMKIDTIIKFDEMGKKYGEYRLHKPIVYGAEVQVKPGQGYGLPTWVRSLRSAKVLAKKDDASLVQFIRGRNMRSLWLNDSELVRVGE